MPTPPVGASAGQTGMGNLSVYKMLYSADIFTVSIAHENSTAQQLVAVGKCVPLLGLKQNSATDTNNNLSERIGALDAVMVAPNELPGCILSIPVSHADLGLRLLGILHVT